ncbi:MAG: helix-turn-helix transcriptional regulator [Methylobacter sp.]
MNKSQHKTSGYWTTKDLMERYKVSKRTLTRWMDRKENPLPAPKIKATGSQNRWSIDALIEWENGDNMA